MPWIRSFSLATSGAGRFGQARASGDGAARRQLKTNASRARAFRMAFPLQRRSSATTAFATATFLLPATTMIAMKAGPARAADFRRRAGWSPHARAPPTSRHAEVSPAAKEAIFAGSAPLYRHAATRAGDDALAFHMLRFDIDDSLMATFLYAARWLGPLAAHEALR